MRKYEATPEEMEVLKFLLNSLSVVDLSRTKDRMVKFFPEELGEEQQSLDEEQRMNKLQRMQETADAIYSRVFCGWGGRNLARGVPVTGSGTRS
jgi:hypothetical protein